MFLINFVEINPQTDNKTGQPITIGYEFTLPSELLSITTNA